MTKQLFIESLRDALNGKVSPGRVTENMRYYEDYINVEIRKGKSEEEVLEALGDPRLIARTITETYDEGGGSPGRQGGKSYRADRGPGYGPLGLLSRRWVWTALAVLVILVIVGVVFSVAAILLPVLLPVFGILFLVRLFQSRRK